MSLLNESQIKGALQRLGELAAEDGITIELIVVGGAAMVLASSFPQKKRERFVRWLRLWAKNMVYPKIG